MIAAINVVKIIELISVLEKSERKKWACLAMGFNILVSAVGLNLPDKRVDSDCWLRPGFQSPLRQLGYKPLSWT